jgi:hypothetical protein
MARKISEDIVTGIELALERHAPHLVPNLDEIVSTAKYEEPAMGLGVSIYGTFANTVSPERGEPIQRALDKVENDLGFDALFADRQISYLSHCWRQFVQP